MQTYGFHLILLRFHEKFSKECRNRQSDYRRQHTEYGTESSAPFAVFFRQINDGRVPPTHYHVQKYDRKNHLKYCKC